MLYGKEAEEALWMATSSASSIKKIQGLDPLRPPVIVSAVKHCIGFRIAQKTLLHRPLRAFEQIPEEGQS